MSKASAPRMFFAAMPPPEFVAAGSALLDAHGWDKRLGRGLFAPANWHQSFSERIYGPTPAQCDALTQVGDAVAGHACTLQFNRVDSTVHPSGRIYWTLRAQGKPKAFDELLAAVQAPLEKAGYTDIATGVTPHVTLSYAAPDRLERPVYLQQPLRWTIDELLLVIGGGGQTYSYDIVGRWPLLPETDPPATQMGLF